ncbi:MAG TPA: YafY family transcriptional regulator [Firmicutes bacterium]|nr:YafY family transcriptional regulator [Bacillota bacterium]
MKIDRLIGILSILLQQEKVTAPFLADKFEVSRRTINRDIEDLCKAGIPLVTAQGVNGGISIMEGYKIDSTLLTSADMQAILAGLRSLDSVSGTNRYAQLMEKLSAGASDFVPGDQHILIDLSSLSKSSLSPKIELIHGAIEYGRYISFHYFAPKGETSRMVEPYYLLFHWANWYVWGYCREREDYRLFKLNRMTELQLKEPFEKRAAPLPDLSNEKVFPPTYLVKALVAPEYRWRLVEEYGPTSFTEQEDGKLLFSFGFTDEESVLSWILSFQGGAELLEPVSFRKKLAEIGKKLQKGYTDS